MIRAAGLLAAMLAGAAPAMAQTVSLDLQRQPGQELAVATNRSGGPVEVELTARLLEGYRAEPGLPTRRLLAPGERAVLARLVATDDGGRHDLHLASVPGEPYAVASDIVYSLPVEESRFALGQGFHGGYSHADEGNRYAVDLVVPEGTPVLAARGGVVMQATGGFRDGGTDRSLAERANLVRVLHDDGSMALYAHLREGGVVVRTGDRVTLGQVLGYAGSTGYSSGPHLHFAVQVNGGMRLVSVPFRMIGPEGFLPLGR